MLRPLLLVAAAVAVLLAGCLDPQLDATDTAPADALEDGVLEVKGERLEAFFSGFLVYRVPGDRSWEGDDPGQCFQVPRGTSRMVGVLDWEPQEEQMGLQFRHRGAGGSFNSWSGGTGELYRPPPITLEVEAPESGEWFMYGGPGIAGGLVTWSVALTLEGASPDHDLRARGC